VDALPEGAREATLRGYRTVWQVAMDNSVDLPGYKYYLDPASGERPAVYVTFLDLTPDPTAMVAGVVFPVDDGTLAALDARERNYERADVTDRIDPPLGGPVHAYFGSAPAHRRYEAGKAAGTAVIARAYVDAVGPSIEPAPVPIRDLRRVDLPAQLAERPFRP
jgi:dephospho-CoA kinase